MARENRGERNMEKIWRSHYIEGEDRHVQREICDMHDRVGDMLRVKCRLSRVAPIWLKPSLRRGRHGGLRAPCIYIEATHEKDQQQRFTFSREATHVASDNESLSSTRKHSSDFQLLKVPTQLKEKEKEKEKGPEPLHNSLMDDSDSDISEDMD